VRFPGSVVLLAALAACATAQGDPRDPFEGFNRGVYRFNETVDAAIAKPVATAYRDLVHEEIRNRVRNFFSNIADLFIGVNNLLQGKIQDGVEDWARFAFNSTFGLLGIHDVATDMGIEKHNEDFGQTLGRWGVADGPYLVLPILGSSTLRDSVGTAADIYTDPVGDFRPPGQCARRSAGREPHPGGGGARQVRLPARRLPAAPQKPHLRRPAAARGAAAGAGANPRGAPLRGAGQRCACRGR